LFLEVNGIEERSRDSMVSSLALGHETEVVLDNRDERVLDFPFADVTEGLAADGGLLGGLRWCPSFRPVASKLLNERSFDRCGLVARIRVD
jgi:hypothetical protein